MAHYSERHVKQFNKIKEKFNLMKIKFNEKFSSEKSKAEN